MDRSSPSIPLSYDAQVGDEVILPIVSAPLRTTLFPESAPLVSIGPDAIEVIFLRNEVVFTAQQGRVIDVHGDSGVELSLAPPTVQMLDLGHVRLTPALAIDLGVSLLKHVVKHHGIELDDITARLQPADAAPYNQ